MNYYLSHLKKCFNTNLDSHILHTNVVPLMGFTRLVAGLVFLQPVSNRLGRLDHIFQLVWVWRRVPLQVPFLDKVKARKAE